MPVRDRRKAASIFAVVLVATVVAAGGCSLRGSGYQYVRNSDVGAYLKVPEAWSVSPIGEDERGVLFGRSFDAAARPLDERSPETSEQPTGSIVVQSLSIDERDQISLQTLRNARYPIDQKLEAGDYELLDVAAEVDGVYRGERVEFRDNRTAGRPTIVQVTFLNAANTRLYVLYVGCRLACFDRHEDDIRTVVDSFTLKEP